MDMKVTDPAVLMREIGGAARDAARTLGFATAERKHAALIGAAEAIMDRKAEILNANAEDMTFAEEKGISAAMLDRLRLDEGRIRSIEGGLKAVADQPDPVGEEIAEWRRPNGLRIRRVRTPLGVVGVIFESRPNVTADAGGLCLKSGNAAILRGGSESFHSSGAIHACLVDGLRAANLPEASIQLAPTRDRAFVGEMLRATEFIDVIVPRGGKGLVGLVQEEARVPVFAHLEGICHVYLDASADPEKAQAIVLNAKTRRTGICGAAECLLVDKAFLSKAAPTIEALLAAGVELRGDDQIRALSDKVLAASEDDWGREFLDMILAARVVDGVTGAVDHIARYGSNHTECIITEDDAAADYFFTRLDSAILMRNASTQFADGGEFGMGAEIGIATGKMHARGPVGAAELTSFKYLVEGDGTIRP